MSEGLQAIMDVCQRLDAVLEAWCRYGVQRFRYGVFWHGAVSVVVQMLSADAGALARRSADDINMSIHNV